MLYPFSDAELAQMRDEFHKIDKEKNSQLVRLKAELANVSSSTQIEDALHELEALEEYFFDTVRKSEAAGLRKSYSKLYRGIVFEADKPEGGKCRFRFKLNGRSFKLDVKPTVKSNCATRLAVRSLEGGAEFEVSYDTIDCLPEEENWLEISYRLRSARDSQKIWL